MTRRLQTFFDTILKLLYSVALKPFDGPEAQDAVQETVIR